MTYVNLPVIVVGRSIYLHQVQQGHRLQHSLELLHQCLLRDSRSGHDVVEHALQHALTHRSVHTAVNHAPRTADKSHVSTA